MKARYRELDWREFPFRRYADLLHEKRLESASFVAARPALELCLVRPGTEQHVWQCSVCGDFADERSNLKRHRDGKCPGANTRQVVVCERLCGRLVLKSHLESLSSVASSATPVVSHPMLAPPPNASAQQSASTARSNSADAEEAAAQDAVSSPKKRAACAPPPGAKSAGGASLLSSFPVAPATSVRMRQNTGGAGTSSSKSSGLLPAAPEAEAAAPALELASSSEPQPQTQTAAAEASDGPVMSDENTPVRLKALVPRPAAMSRPAIAEKQTVEIFWKAGVEPFLLPADKWELVDNWDNITVYKWEELEEKSGLGQCCVGCHPHPNVPVQTQWRTISRSGRRGRSMVSTNLLSAEDLSLDCISGAMLFLLLQLSCASHCRHVSFVLFGNTGRPPSPMRWHW